MSPADRTDLTFEPGLVDRILDDVGDEPGNLPLLEFVLQRLWEQRQERTMRHEDYDAMGRLKGAIAAKAEDVFAKLSGPEQSSARRLLLQLVRLGDKMADTKRRIRLQALGPDAEHVMYRLTNERLLVTTAADTASTETVELAHEALIQSWNRFRGWLREDREFLLWREGLSNQVEAWQRSQGDEDALGQCHRPKNPGCGRLHQCLHLVRSHGLLDRCAEGRGSHRPQCPVRRDDEFNAAAGRI